jgi:hypothetical protein
MLDTYYINADSHRIMSRAKQILTADFAWLWNPGTFSALIVKMEMREVTMKQSKIGRWPGRIDESCQYEGY